MKKLLSTCLALALLLGSFCTCPSVARAEAPAPGSPGSLMSQTDALPGTAAFPEGAAQAYLSLLEAEETAIKGYTWQMGYYGYGEQREDTIPHPVVFCDFTGDETPEMIYVKRENDYLARLSIVTWESGSLRELYLADWDPLVAGGQGYYFYQLKGERTLYVYASTGDEWWLDLYSSFAENPDGTLDRVGHLQCYSHPGDTQETYTTTYHEYLRDGMLISAEEYEREKAELEANTASILMVNSLCKAFAKDYVLSNGCPAMTWEEAVAFLRSRLEPADPEKLDVSVDALPDGLDAFLIQFCNWYRGPNGEYHADRAADGSSNILASIVSNGSAANFSLYPGKGPEYHWSEANPMGWPGDSYEIFDGPTVDWIAKNIFNVPDSDLEKLCSEAEAQRLFHREEFGGSYRYLTTIGGVGDGFLAIRVSSAQFDGEKYFLVYELLFDDGFSTPEHLETYHTVLTYKSIDGGQYWSMYDHEKYTPLSPDGDLSSTDQVVAAVKQYALDKINRMFGDSYSMEMIDDYFSYQLCSAPYYQLFSYTDHDDQTIYFVTYSVYRTDADEVLVLPSGRVVPVSDSAADPYVACFDFNIRRLMEQTEYEKFKRDPSYQCGGFDYQ